MNRKDLNVLPLPLTLTEREELARYEGTIYEGLSTFFEVGKALIEIRNRKLYRVDYRTFEQYCRERWNISRAHAYRMIDAAEVVDNLSPNRGQILPANELQARALKAAPPEQRQEIWQKAIDASNGSQPTAKQITHVIQTELPLSEPEPEPESEPLIRSPQVYDQHLRDYERITITTPDEVIKITAPRLSQNETVEQRDLVFDIVFDGEDHSQRFEIVVKTSPLIAQQAEERGMCATCTYAYSTHYLNEDGQKWCTISILQNQYLREKLQTEKIPVYDIEKDFTITWCPDCGKAVTQGSYGQITCSGCGRKWGSAGCFRNYCAEREQEDAAPEPQQPQNPMITAGYWKIKIPDDIEIGENNELFAHSKHGERFKSEASKADKEELIRTYCRRIGKPEPIRLKICDFCGHEFPDNHLYYDDHHPMICGGCARKALFALLKIDSYGGFKWYVRDRDKIMRAGLRLFQIDGYYKELKEYTPARNSTAEGVDISTWGSWKRFETFPTKKALKARIEELEDNPTIIFENHLYF